MKKVEVPVFSKEFSDWYRPFLFGTFHTLAFNLNFETFSEHASKCRVHLSFQKRQALSFGGQTFSR